MSSTRPSTSTEIESSLSRSASESISSQQYDVENDSEDQNNADRYKGFKSIIRTCSPYRGNLKKIITMGVMVVGLIVAIAYTSYTIYDASLDSDRGYNRALTFGFTVSIIISSLSLLLKLYGVIDKRLSPDYKKTIAQNNYLCFLNNWILRDKFQISEEDLSDFNKHYERDMCVYSHTTHVLDSSATGAYIKKQNKELTNKKK